jgi:hypothetical protein
MVDTPPTNQPTIDYLTLLVSIDISLIQSQAFTACNRPITTLQKMPNVNKYTAVIVQSYVDPNTHICIVQCYRSIIIQNERSFL